MSLLLRRGWWFGGVFLIACLAMGAYWYLDSSRPSALRAAADPSPGPASDESLKGLTLPQEQREYLWQIEHHFNLLSQIGFKEVARAIRELDDRGLEKVLAADFRGQAPEQAQEFRTRSDAVEVVRRSASGGLRALDGKQFIAELLNLRKQFDKPPQVKVSVMALSPVRREQPEGPWRGTCQLRLWGTWHQGKPAEVIAYLAYRVKQPPKISEEKDQDREQRERTFFAAGGWVLECTLTQVQTGKAERFLFREAAAERGLEPDRFHDNWKNSLRKQPTTGGVYLFDFNRDGHLDVLMTDLTGVYLYQGLPNGKFKNVTSEVGLVPENAHHGDWKFQVIVADLDGDGWDDLAVSGDVYRNDAGRRFVNITGHTNLRLRPGMQGVAVADYDRDGKLDLYLFRASPGKAGTWIDGKGHDRFGNVLLRNKGNWQFEDVTDSSGTSGDNRSTFSAVWLDADGDGWPDLYVPNEFGNGVLYRNKGNGTFSSSALHDGPTDFGSMGLTAGDIFNEGRISLYVAGMYSKAGSRVIGNMWPKSYPDDIMAKIRTFVVGSRLHRNEGGLKFREMGTQMGVHDAGWAYGPALADLDNDGWLDLYATAGYMSQSRDKPDG